MRRRSLGALLVAGAVLLLASTTALAGTTATTLVGVTVSTTTAGTTQIAITTSSAYFTIGPAGQYVYEAGVSAPIFTTGNAPGASNAPGNGVSTIATDSSGNLYLSQGTAINEITNPGTSSQSVETILSNWDSPNPQFGEGDPYGEGIIVVSSGNLIVSTYGEPFHLYLLSNTCTVTTCPYGAEAVTNQSATPFSLASGWKIFQIPVPSGVAGELSGMLLSGANLYLGEWGSSTPNQIWELAQSGTWTDEPITPTPGNSSSDRFEVPPEMLSIDSWGNLLMAYENGSGSSAQVGIYVLPTATDINCSTNCPYGMYGVPAGTIVNFISNPIEGVNVTATPQLVGGAITAQLLHPATSGSSLDLLGFSSEAKNMYVNDSGSLDAVATKQFVDPGVALKSLKAKKSGKHITVTISPRIYNYPVTLRVRGLNANKRLAWLTVSTATTNAEGQVTFSYKGHGTVDVSAKNVAKDFTSQNFAF